MRMQLLRGYLGVLPVGRMIQMDEFWFRWNIEMRITGRLLWT